MDLSKILTVTTPQFIDKPYAWVQHIPFARYLIEVLKPKIFVELGTHSGNSYFAFCQAINQLKLATKSYAVDTWNGDEHASFYPEDVFKRVRDINKEHFSITSSLLRMTFDQALEYFSENTIDLLHIDGLHTYEAVKHDFETWLPKMSNEGVIIMHDTAVREREFGVWRLWEELSTQYPSFDFLHGNGLGVLCVGKNVNKDFLSFVETAAKQPDIRNLFATLGSRVQAIQEKEDLQKELLAIKKNVRALEKTIENHANVTQDLNTRLDAHKAAIQRRNEQIEKFREEQTKHKEEVLDYKIKATENTESLRYKSDQIEELRRELARAKEEILEHKVKATETTQKINEKNAQIDKLREEQTKHKEEVLDYKIKATENTESLRYKSDQIEELRRDLARAKEEILEHKVKATETTQKINEKNAQIDKLSDELAKRKEQIHDYNLKAIENKALIVNLQEELTRRNADIEDYKGINTSINQKVSEQIGQIEKLQEELTRRNADIEDYSNRLTQGSRQLEETIKKLNNTDLRITELCEEQSRLEKELKTAKQLCSAKAERIEKQANELNQKQNQITALQKAKAEAVELVRKREATIGSLQKKNENILQTNKQQKQEIDKLENQVKHILNSASWKVTKPLRWSKRVIKTILTALLLTARILYFALTCRIGKVKNEIRILKYRRIVLKSGEFDKQWYLQKYPDVAKAGVDPIIHYLKRGVIEHRDPSPKFGTALYLQQYGDVFESGINPLVHYILYGKKEGRVINNIIKIKPVSTVANTKKIEKTALVIVWDIGHNPVGRAYMLAEVLDTIFRNVVIVGFQFTRYGSDIWEPLRKSRLPIIDIPCTDIADLNRLTDTIAQRFKPDIVFACKTRFPSMLLGFKLKKKFNCPLVVDIDDHELTFVGETEEMSYNDLNNIKNIEAKELNEPYSATWTRVAQNMRKHADAIIVSSKALQNEFGGVVVPHVRDENVFNPALFNKTEARAKYGVPGDDKIILFFGTPRLHKGLGLLAKTVGEINNNKIKLLIVGDAPDKSVISNLRELSKGNIILLGNQPFATIPEVVSMADVVCLPQNLDNAISKYQLPAKAIDAIAMNIPLLVTATPPLKDIVLDGLAIEVNDNNIKETILRILSEPIKNSKRDIFLKKYSYKAAASTLRTLVDGIMTNPMPIDVDEANLLEMFLSNNISAKHNNEKNDTAIDYVLFWKQNDTALYGRRVDMIAKYLATRIETGKVLIIDSPISTNDLLTRRSYSENEMVEHRHIYLLTYKKALGLLDNSNTHYDVFIYNSRKDNVCIKNDSKAFENLYIDFIRNVFEREKINPEKSVFLMFPKNFYANSIINSFHPGYLITDVVDDHRAWPNLSQEQIDKLTVNYSYILGSSDQVLCNCEEVKAKMVGFNNNIRVIQNGCDTDIGTPPSPRNNPYFHRYMQAVDSGRCIIGFVGNLEKKINIPLLKQISESCSDALIVLIGSVHSNPDILELKNIGNILMPGVVGYNEVSNWISKFNVAIIPHLDMKLTKSMNPLKSYVYLSHNIPVVSSNVDNIPNKVKGFFIAKNNEEFIQQIKNVLNNKERYDFSDFIKNNSWESRLSDFIDNVIGELRSNNNHLKKTHKQ